mmetsp:Transcript_23009/g.68927  ORF Transcript_23009/g.68927 Transcript_23009/m.68927 type:complete len:274 (+) Transcript_23009:334-1155(+)
MESTLRDVATFHAKFNMLTTTPASTAAARSSQIVSTVTRIATAKSKALCREKSSKKPHAIVFMDAIATMPTGAAAGMCATNGPNSNTLRPSKAPVTKPDRRLMPPLPTFMNVWTERAPPPCVPKRDATMLATPCPKHSRRIEPPVPVISSTRDCAIRLSNNPAIANRTAAGITLAHMWGSRHSTPLGGKAHAGTESSPPSKVSFPAMSSSVLPANQDPQKVAKPHAKMTATSGAGNVLPTPGVLLHMTPATTAKTATVVKLQKVSATHSPSRL